MHFWILLFLIRKPYTNFKRGTFFKIFHSPLNFIWFTFTSLKRCCSINGQSMQRCENSEHFLWEANFFLTFKMAETENLENGSFELARRKFVKNIIIYWHGQLSVLPTLGHFLKLETLDIYVGKTKPALFSLGNVSKKYVSRPNRF